MCIIPTGYLRHNERLAKVVAAQVHQTAGEGRVLCIDLEISQAARDRIDLRCPGQSQDAQLKRLGALSAAAGIERLDDSSQLLGKQVIVVLGNHGAIAGYRPPIHGEY